MTEEEKFKQIEEPQILTLLNALFPDEVFNTRKGEVDFKEPDGIITNKNRNLAIEVCRFTDDDE